MKFFPLTNIFYCFFMMMFCMQLMAMLSAGTGRPVRKGPPNRYIALLPVNRQIRVLTSSSELGKSEQQNSVEASGTGGTEVMQTQPHPIISAIPAGLRPLSVPRSILTNESSGRPATSQEALVVRGSWTGGPIDAKYASSLFSDASTTKPIAASVAVERLASPRVGLSVGTSLGTELSSIAKSGGQSAKSAKSASESSLSAKKSSSARAVETDATRIKRYYASQPKIDVTMQKKLDSQNPDTMVAPLKNYVDALIGTDRYEHVPLKYLVDYAEEFIRVTAQGPRGSNPIGFVVNTGVQLLGNFLRSNGPEAIQGVASKIGKVSVESIKDTTYSWRVEGQDNTALQNLYNGLPILNRIFDPAHKRIIVQFELTNSQFMEGNNMKAYVAKLREQKKYQDFPDTVLQEYVKEWFEALTPEQKYETIVTPHGTKSSLVIDKTKPKKIAIDSIANIEPLPRDADGNLNAHLTSLQKLDLTMQAMKAFDPAPREGIDFSAPAYDGAKSSGQVANSVGAANAAEGASEPFSSGAMQGLVQPVNDALIRAAGGGFHGSSVKIPVEKFKQVEGAAQAPGVVPAAQKQPVHIAVKVPKVSADLGNADNILTVVGLTEANLQKSSWRSVLSSVFKASNAADIALTVKLDSPEQYDKYDTAYKYSADPQAAFIRLQKDIIALRAKIVTFASNKEVQICNDLVAQAEAAAGRMNRNIIDTQVKTLMSQSVPSTGVSIETAFAAYKADKDRIALDNPPDGHQRSEVQKSINKQYSDIYQIVVDLLDIVRKEEVKIARGNNPRGDVTRDFQDKSVDLIKQEIDELDLTAQLTEKNLPEKFRNDLGLYRAYYTNIVKRELENQLLKIDKKRAEQREGIEYDTKLESQKIWSKHIKKLSEPNKVQLSEQQLHTKLIQDVVAEFKQKLLTSLGQKEFSSEQLEVWKKFEKNYKDSSEIITDLSTPQAENAYNKRFTDLITAFKAQADLCQQFKDMLGNLNYKISKLKIINESAMTIANDLIDNHKVNIGTIGWIQKRIQDLQDLSPTDPIDTNEESKKINERYNAVDYKKGKNILTIPANMTNEELIRFYEKISEKFQSNSSSYLAFNSFKQAWRGWFDKDTSTLQAAGSSVVAVGGALVRVPFVGTEGVDALVNYVDTAVLNSMGIDLKAPEHNKLKILIMIVIVIPTLQQLQAIQSDKNLTDEEKEELQHETTQNMMSDTLNLVAGYQLGADVDIIKTGDAKAIGTSMLLNKMVQSMSPDSGGIYNYDPTTMNSQQYTTNLAKSQRRHQQLSQKNADDPDFIAKSKSHKKLSTKSLSNDSGSSNSLNNSNDYSDVD